MSSVAENIPYGWDETNLGKLGRVITGKTPSKNNPDDWGEVIDFITPSEIDNSSKYIYDTPRKLSRQGFDRFSRMIIPNNSVIVTCIGSDMGKVVMNKNQALTNQQINSIVVGDEYNNDYVFYLLKNAYRVLRRNAEGSGSTMPILNKSSFESLAFVIPKDIEEQKAIANILTAFDDKIENLQAQNNTLEQTAQTIFKEWFGKYQVGDELPDGWSVGKLSEIAEFLNGLALQKYPPIAGEETLPVIKIRELKQGITSNTDNANTHLDKKYIIQNGDVLFSWSGSLEVVIWQNGKGALNQHLFKVSSEGFPKWFYYFWILHHLREFKGVAANKATTMGHINRKHLDLAEVIIPDEVSLEKYNQIFNPLIEKLENNHQQIQTLKQTRDTLLPKLMSGQLRVNGFK